MHWATSSIAIMFVLLFLNGWAQGMGWPPCGRTMVHWWSQKERGEVVAVWNVAHNVGGGMIGPLFILGMGWFNDWRSAFYVPAAAAAAIAVIAFFVMRDTPQSVGLPPIEEYKNDYPKELQREPRAGVLRQGDLRQVRAAQQTAVVHRDRQRFRLPHSLRCAGLGANLPERGQVLHRRQLLLGLLPLRVGRYSGYLLCGWISDKMFQGRRAPAGILFMVLVTLAVLVYWFNPAGNPTIGHDGAGGYRLPDSTALSC